MRYVGMLGLWSLCCVSRLFAGADDGSRPLRGEVPPGRDTPCQNAIWDNGYAATPHLTVSSQTSAYPLFDSQAADDFRLDSDEDLTQVSWVGAYWDPGPPADPNDLATFRVIFYAEGSACRPVGGPNDPTGSALVVYTFPSAQVHVSEGPTEVHSGYRVVLAPPFHVSANVKYWLAIQAVLDYPPQWGWASHLVSPQPLCSAAWGCPFLGTSYWQVMEPVQATNFCLACAQNPAHPCQLNGDVSGNGEVDNFDINVFVYALSHTAAQFTAQHPSGNYWCADTDCNGVVDNFDINRFVACLTHQASCLNCP